MTRLQEKKAEHIKNEHKAPWYLFSPTSVTIKARDMMSATALVMLFFILPYEIAFVDAPNMPDPSSGLYIFNRVIDAIFVVEMIMECFTGVEINPLDLDAEDEDLRVDDAISQAVVYDYHLPNIFCTYLKGWLVIDVVRRHSLSKSASPNR